jgi:ribosomal protein S12 methylthiotransferase accessory factor
MTAPEAGGDAAIGQRRLVPPEQTLERLRPHLARMGITRIANVTGLDRIGIPVVTVVRPNARSLAVSQGKGTTIAAAKVSAIMEAAELFHAETISGPLWWMRPDELIDEWSFLDPLDLPGSSTAPAHDGPIAWIEGIDLRYGGPVLVPFAAVSADYTRATDALSAGICMTTSGLGAGNDRDEALLQGLTELVERDAVTLWRLGGRQRRSETAVDPAALIGTPAGNLLAQLQSAGLRVGLWDATSDIDLPVIVCLIAGRDASDADPEFGAGCHPCAEIAALRAILEALQARLTFIAGSRDDMGGELYEPGARAGRYCEAERWLQTPVAGRPLAVGSGDPAVSAADGLELALSAVSAAGVRLLAAVELTRPEIGVPVFRVVAAGLEGPSDAPDYVPGHRARRAGAQ